MKHAFILLSIIISFLNGNSQSKKSELFDQSSVKMSEIKTNTIRSDFGPAIIGDSIYFSSFRDELINKSDKKLKTKEFYDLYSARIDESGDVISGRRALVEFITRFHDGPVSWCSKTGELFITQSNYVDPAVRFKTFRKENIRLRIVVAKKLKDVWTIVEEFPYNNAEYSVGHPAISESGDSLYFASDMPGGFGATDIYMSIRKSGKWNPPVNLGPQVNTSEKDEFPFITGNSYPGRFLIFASTGHNSGGGFDLFYTNLNDRKGEVCQFRAPINSTNDDFAMNLPENVEYGYMTSNRPGTGNDDIYKLTFLKYLEYLQEILVLDAKTWNPIPLALVNFCNKRSIKTGSDGLVSFWMEKNSVCNVTASALGYTDNHKLIKMGYYKQGTVLRDTIFLNIIVNEKIVLRNIYYDFDKWDIIPESAEELDRLVSLMKENPDMKVELSSHTDIRGSAIYNMKLSQLRAQSAVDYLISKGIDKSKITGTGYGKTQLINISVSGQKLESAQHRENRRTEIYIPGFSRGEPVKQLKGDYSDGKPDHTAGYSSYKEHGYIVGNTAKPAGVSSGTDAMNYYLILGSFREKINASNFVQLLISEGHKAIIIGESEPLRVGIGYESVRQAKKALEDLKDKYPTGWILVN
jgi:outer membrane protein OmpA-like peptidoglycan-associated protein